MGYVIPQAPLTADDVRRIVREELAKQRKHSDETQGK
jgi:hypothetical protein